MTLRAALLDGRDIYQGIVEIEPGQLTDRHLPQIAECDLPVGKYQWVPNPANPYGGAFWLKSWVDKVTAECRGQLRSA